MSQLGLAARESFGTWLRKHFADQCGRVVLVVTTVLAGCLGSWAQTDSVALADLLGPHGDTARGCGTCHAARSADLVPTQSEASAQIALWGATAAPEYGGAIALADEARVVEVRPAAIASGSRDVTGILLCLSCHDGNIVGRNMLQSSSYERELGLLAGTVYRDQKLMSLLGRDEAPTGDHPLGAAAMISPGSGLVFSNGGFSVLPNSPYAQFVADYGWPSLAPARTQAYGLSHSGEPYALCTTCHDQHMHRVYRSDPRNPIAGDGGGKLYATFSFLNGPYDPAPNALADHPTTSAVQFCRQCHFDLANEGNNTTRPTVFF